MQLLQWKDQRNRLKNGLRAVSQSSKVRTLLRTIKGEVHSTASCARAITASEYFCTCWPSSLLVSSSLRSGKWPWSGAATTRCRIPGCVRCGSWKTPCGRTVWTPAWGSTGGGRLNPPGLCGHSTRPHWGSLCARSAQVWCDNLMRAPPWTQRKS